MKKLNSALKLYFSELLYFAGTKTNIRLVYLAYCNKYTVTVFFTDNTIKNLMKGEIIL